MEERVQQLEAELATSQQQMMMAATFGQNLLAENEKLKAQLAQQQQRSDTQGDGDNATLLNAQLIEAQSANDGLLAEVNEKDGVVQSLEKQLKLAQKAAEQIDELKQSNAELKEQLEQKASDYKHVQEKLIGATNDNKSLSSELEATMKQLEDVQERFQESKTVGALSPRKLAEDALEELEALRAENKELSSAKVQMETGVFALSKENQRMQRDLSEQTAFLAQAKQTISKLREAQNDAQQQEAGGSLLAELENEMNVHVQNQEEAQEARKKEAESEDAPDNCMEYFLTLQTALKIGLTLKYPHKADLVYSVRGVDLYYKMVNARVPFHAWYPWTRKYLHQMAFGKDVKPAALSASKQAEKQQPLQSKWSSITKFLKGDK